MTSAIQHFIEAHDYCHALETFLQRVLDDYQRDVLRQELLRAYDDLDRKAQAVVRVRFAEGVFMETN